ncbi:MAG: hypothetical protein ACQER7_11980 [Bacteroidota bacterium]
MLTGYEGEAFSSTGHFREGILSITAVQRMREDAVMKLLHETEGTQKNMNHEKAPFNICNSGSHGCMQEMTIHHQNSMQKNPPMQATF